MHWLSNIYDPKRPDAKIDLKVGETQEHARQRQQCWLENKIIDAPQPTAVYTVAQLEAMHWVGVYSNCKES